MNVVSSNGVGRSGWTTSGRLIQEDVDILKP